MCIHVHQNQLQINNAHIAQLKAKGGIFWIKYIYHEWFIYLDKF
jgi:hypothetical protein